MQGLDILIGYRKPIKLNGKVRTLVISYFRLSGIPMHWVSLIGQLLLVIQ